MAQLPKTHYFFSNILKHAIRIWWLWPLIAMVATYCIIMLFSIGQSIWFDEGYSILLAHRPVSDLLALTAVDAHPPLYYLLLKGWANMFGWSEYALRSLSAVAAALTVGTVFFIVRQLFTVRTALAILPFVVLAPFALRYGYEVRMYALAGLIGALATLTLIYAYERRSARLWALYAVCVALGMYTLYMTVALWIAHVVWLVLASHRSGQSFFKQKWVMAFIGAIILFLPYIMTFVNQLLHSALPGIGSALTITRLGDIVSMIITFTPEWKVSGIVALGLLMIIGLIIYLIPYIRQTLSDRRRSSLQLLLILVIIPVAFFALLSLVKPIFVDRYMAHVVIYSYVLVGVVVALGWDTGKRLFAGILASVSLLLLFIGVLQLQQTGNFVFERMQYPQTAEIRASVRCDNTLTIVADDPYTYIDTSYYFDSCDLRFYSSSPVENKGGYAPLRTSTARISHTTDVTSLTLMHIHLAGLKPSFVPDSRYQLVQTTTYGNQVVDEYRYRSVNQ